MSSKAYSLIVNITGAVVIGSAFAYNSLGRYQWIAIGLTIVCCVASATAYLMLHWGKHARSEDSCAAAEVVQTQLIPAKPIEYDVVRREPLHGVYRRYDVVALSAHTANAFRAFTSNTEVVKLQLDSVHAELVAAQARIDQLENYLKMMERGNWSAPSLPLDVLQETENVVTFNRRTTSKGKRPTSKASFGTPISLFG